MGLVDYSDSESDSEPVAKPTPAASLPAGGKKPFQKVIDRSKPGKIVVNLPQSSGPAESATTTNGDEPPAKRARTTRGGGAFSGFHSFLPPPKNARKSATAAASGSGNNAPKPGINLKTGAAPGFSRETDADGDTSAFQIGNTTSDGGMSLPAPKSQQPSIPSEQIAAEDVKLVGKPLMFKPLSVSRKPGKKTAAKSIPSMASRPAAANSTPAVIAPATKGVEEAPPKKKKVSLFSISDDVPEVVDSTPNNGVYEPLFGNSSNPDDDNNTPSTTDAFAAYDAQFSAHAAAPTQAAPSTSTANSLDTIASDMNLSAAARRELFGRSGAPNAARVISFNTEHEYAHNEALRASGEQTTYNPVRAIAPGKHSLRQLVNQVHSQKDALEESFAKGKSKQQEAGSRYGWR